MSPSQTKIMDTKKGIIEYLDEGEGIPVLAIHGAMGGYDQSHTLFKTIVKGITNYRCIAVSRPGYLGTPIQSGKSPESQADLYAALLDELNIDQIIVMAISDGGPSAMQFATRHQSRCQKLILCSTISEPGNEKIPFSFSILTALSKVSPLMKMMKNKTEKNIHKTMEQLILDQAIRQKTMDNEEAMSLLKEVVIGSFDKISKRMIGTKNDIRIAENFSMSPKKINIPTLIIHGTDDRRVPFGKHVGKLLAIKSSQKCILEKGDHITIFSHRDQVQQSVTTFLAN